MLCENEFKMIIRELQTHEYLTHETKMSNVNHRDTYCHSVCFACFG